MAVACEEPRGRGAGGPAAEDGNVDRFTRVGHGALDDAKPRYLRARRYSTDSSTIKSVTLTVVGLVLSSAIVAASMF